MSDEEKAYIAGFLDGDGSIMAQLIKRKGYKFGYQIRVSIVFYQKTIHQDHLLWLKKQLGYGYVRIRNDGMSEYTIVGLSEVEHVLSTLNSFLRLKKVLARKVLLLIKQHPSQRKVNVAQFIRLSKLVDETAKFNYTKKRKNTSTEVIEFLLSKNIYVPVETEG